MKSYAQIHLQLSNLQYDEIPLKRCEKRAKKQPFCYEITKHVDSTILTWMTGTL